MIELIIAIISAVASVATAFITKNTNKRVRTIDEIRLENDKTYLTDFISEIENGVPKTEIQKQRASEIYDEYTTLNGNSYVHSHWEKLKQKELI